ncbi:MAG TPA: CGNR zinc finger domain-containing protein [Pseudonocardiaceae bacterium]
MSTAPGRFEQVRTFLNTWRVPHETRLPEDVLPQLALDADDWRAQLPDVPLPSRAELAELVELRAALRAALGTTAPGALRDWFDRHPIGVTVGDEQALRYLPSDTGAPSALLVLVVEALAAGQWARLKSCPDCRNVFYDHSRNHSRTWCAMYAETPDGRACGSIAKVRTYRSGKRKT